jgi:uncharacterized protein YyaL (SSP411 family)
MLNEFWDDEAGGFYFTSRSHESLISRTKDYFDNATPSGNSVAGDVLVRMSALLNRTDYREKAEQIFNGVAGLVSQYPSGFGRMLSGIDFFIGPSKEIIFAGAPDVFLPALRKRYFPRLVSGMGDRPAVDGKPTAYVCENFTCKQPVTTLSEFEHHLEHD